MSGASEATTAINREAFSMNSPSPVMNPAAPQPQQLEQQMQMAFINSDAGAFRQVASSPPAFQSIPAGAGISHAAVAAEQKRKRGRPRKYGPDGSMHVPLGSPQQPINAAMQQQNFSPPPVTAGAAPLSTQTDGLQPMDGSVSPTAKKARGRPRGSRNKVKQHSEALGSTGIGFVPHILNVNTGEQRTVDCG